MRSTASRAPMSPEIRAALRSVDHRDAVIRAVLKATNSDEPVLVDESSGLRLSTRPPSRSTR